MPSIKVVPTHDNSRKGYEAVQRAFGPGWTGPLQIVAPRAEAAQVATVARRDPGIAHVSSRPNWAHDGMAVVQAIPATDPSARATRSRDRASPRSVAGQRRSSVAQWRRATISRPR